MRQAKFKVLKLTALAAAIAATGGCITAKTNPGDEAAMAAPAPESAVAAAAPMTDKGITSYTVAGGDHLWGISEMGDVYGTPFNWPLIYKANTSQINDADLIFPGQELNIPRNSSQGEIDAAVMHSKTRGAWSLGPTEASDSAYISG